jgi:hypothetical protein
MLKSKKKTIAKKTAIREKKPEDKQIANLFQPVGEDLLSDFTDPEKMLLSVRDFVVKTKGRILNADDNGQDWNPPREPRVGFKSEKDDQRIWTIRLSALNLYRGELREMFRSPEGRQSLLSWINGENRF